MAFQSDSGPATMGGRSPSSLYSLSGSAPNAQMIPPAMGQRSGGEGYRGGYQSPQSPGTVGSSGIAQQQGPGGDSPSMFGNSQVDMGGALGLGLRAAGAIPGPIGALASLAGVGVRANNTAYADATRPTFGQEGLSFGQAVGGALGLNSYGGGGSTDQIGDYRGSPVSPSGVTESGGILGLGTTTGFGYTTGEAQRRQTQVANEAKYGPMTDPNTGQPLPSQKYSQLSKNLMASPATAASARASSGGRSAPSSGGSIAGVGGQKESGYSSMSPSQQTASLNRGSLASHTKSSPSSGGGGGGSKSGGKSGSGGGKQSSGGAGGDHGDNSGGHG